MDVFKNRTLEDLVIFIPYNQFIGDPYCDDTHLVEVVEEWKHVPFMPSNIFISSIGRVKSLARIVSDRRCSKNIKTKILKQRFSDKGYLLVGVNKKYYPVHRLVSITFIENTCKKETVNHKYPDKTINIVSNLEWMTSQENVEHSIKYRCYINGITNGKAPRRGKKIAQCYLNGDLVKVWDKMIHINIDGVSTVCVSRVCRGLQESHRGYLWKYA